MQRNLRQQAISQKDRERLEIQQQIIRFLQSGGEISVIDRPCERHPHGVTYAWLPEHGEPINHLYF
ncbi:MAG: hypothetical protein NWR12_02815 [Haliea sp.]|jgi:hypothetical protein|nr:hypothetical protein [Haliea sp.]MDP5064021.1 hypothetical protein [Haliea sp.]